MRVGADHVDVEPRHAALADLVDHAGDAVDRADAVGQQRDPQRPAAARQAALLAAEERGRRGVGDGGDARVEQPERGGLEPVLHPGRVQRGGGEGGGGGAGASDRGRQALLVGAARAPVEVRVAEAVVLEVGEQLGVGGGRAGLRPGRTQPDRREPGAQQCAGIVWAEVAVAPPRPPRNSVLPRPCGLVTASLAEHPLDHPEHRLRVGRPARAAAPERAHRSSAIALWAQRAALP